MFKTDTILDLIENNLNTAFNKDTGTVEKFARSVLRLRSGNLAEALNLASERLRRRFNVEPLLVIQGGSADFSNRAAGAVMVSYRFSVTLVWQRPRAGQGALEADRQALDGYAQAVAEQLDKNRFSTAQVATTRLETFGTPEYLEADNMMLIYQRLEFILQYLSY